VVGKPPTDGRRVRGLATQTSIIREAVQLASTDGLEGLTMARLAERLNIPKSSVHAAFGSKQELQGAVLRETREIMIERVVAPALAAPPGLQRLVALGASWIGYLENEVFEGGCVLSAAASELDGRRGPTRDALVGIMTEWLRLLSDNVQAAVMNGEFAATTEPTQAAFELHSVGLAANWHHQLFGGPAAFKAARAAWSEALARRAAT
jgi:AcrR family transcriptional regulator